MQLAIDIFINMITTKEFWIVIGMCIILGVYMKWSETK